MWRARQPDWTDSKTLTKKWVDEYLLSHYDEEELNTRELGRARLRG